MYFNLFPTSHKSINFQVQHVAHLTASNSVLCRIEAAILYLGLNVGDSEAEINFMYLETAVINTALK